MTRVKKGVHSLKKRRKILQATKGFKWGRKSKERLAREALLHAWSHAFRGRKEKKRNMRALWQIQMSAGVREEGISYSKFIGALHKANVKLNRKILAQLSEKHPAVFKEIVSSVKK